ncbi:zinc finger BED domain-containing protein RICESLEEPER 2 [Tanacetum coccineum]
MVLFRIATMDLASYGVGFKRDGDSFGVMLQGYRFGKLTKVAPQRVLSVFNISPCGVKLLGIARLSPPLYLLSLQGFWKEKETMFPVLSRMAKDIISVQASSDHLDAKERKQDKCPLEIPLDFEEDVFDDEVQQNEAIPLPMKKLH